MLENVNVVLASKSPRRSELLKLIKKNFSVIPSDAEEIVPPEFLPEDVPMYLAAQKALAVAENHPDSLVIGCDTVVILGGDILGKPRDKKHAFKMLSALSGKTHSVVSGVCLCYKGKTLTFDEKTLVSFYQLDEKDILEYIATGSPMDKAGGYGIQDSAALFVKKIDGDYYNVVGLPVARLKREISRLLECVGE